MSCKYCRVFVFAGRASGLRVSQAQSCIRSSLTFRPRMHIAQFAQCDQGHVGSDIHRKAAPASRLAMFDKCVRLYAPLATEHPCGILAFTCMVTSVLSGPSLVHARGLMRYAASGSMGYPWISVRGSFGDGERTWHTLSMPIQTCYSVG